MSWDEGNSSEGGKGCDGGGGPSAMAMVMPSEGGWEYLMEHCDDSPTAVGRGYLDSTTSGREDKYAFPSSARASGVSSPLDWSSSIASPLSTIVGDYSGSGGSSSKHHYSKYDGFNSPDQQHNHIIGINSHHHHPMSNHYNASEQASLRESGSTSAQTPSGSDVHIASYLSVHGVPIVTGGSPTTSIATTTTPDGNKRSHGRAAAVVTTTTTTGGSGSGGGGVSGGSVGGGGGGGGSSSHTCTNSPKSAHGGCSSIGSQHSSDKELNCDGEEDGDFLGLGGPSDAPARKKRIPIPDDRKDAKYWERRKKNNMAAKRSREMRRKKVDIELRSARKAIQENEKLKQEIEVLKTEVNSLRRLLQDANTTLSLWIRARQVSEPNAQLPPMLRGPNISFVNFPVSTASV